MSCTLPRLITVVGHQEVRKNYIGLRTDLALFVDLVHFLFCFFFSIVFILSTLSGKVLCILCNRGPKVKSAFDYT